MSESAVGDGIRAIEVNPEYLHSNSTSHTWVFGAFVELIDNSFDAKAKEISIDELILQGKQCLCFQDDGVGMDQDCLYKMLCFGFSQCAQRNHIGMYGNGFKSGSMRIGDDAIVFTREKESAGIGLLSQTYLKATMAETVFVPMLQYTVPGLNCVNDSNQRKNLQAILKYSPFTKETELLKQMKTLKGPGTLIIIYNLRRMSKYDRLELNFSKDPHDIRCPESDEGECVDMPNYKNSLREYCSILFLKPTMKIKIRGKNVKTRLIAKSLRHSQIDEYKPKGETNSIQITFGMFPGSETTGDFGMMLYRNNRLIKPYEKVMCQKRNDGTGKGVVGVTEAKFLTPTHIKQDFIRDEKFNAAMIAFNTKLRSYWNDRQNDESASPPSHTEWVQCDNKDCLKWRRLPQDFDMTTLPDKWYCYMHPNDITCSFPEDVHDADEEIKRLPRKRRLASKRKSEDNPPDLSGRSGKQKNASSPNLETLVFSYNDHGHSVTEFTESLPSASYARATASVAPVASATSSIQSPFRKTPGASGGNLSSVCEQEKEIPSQKGSKHAKISNTGANTSNNVVRTSNTGASTSNNVVRTSNTGASTSNNVVRTSNNVASTSNNVVRTSNTGASTSNNVVRTSNNVASTSNNVVRTSNTGASTSNNVVRTSNNVASTSNNVVRTSNTGASTSNAVKSSPLKETVHCKYIRQAEPSTNSLFMMEDINPVSRQIIGFGQIKQESAGNDKSCSWNTESSVTTDSKNIGSNRQQSGERDVIEASEGQDNIEIRKDEKTNEISEMRNRLDAKEKEISEMRNRLDAKEKEFSNVKSKLDEKEMEISDIKSKLDAVRVSLRDVEKQKDEIRGQYISFQNQIRQLMAILTPDVPIDSDVNIELLVHELINSG